MVQATRLRMSFPVPSCEFLNETLHADPYYMHIRSLRPCKDNLLLAQSTFNTELDPTLFTTAYHL